MRDEKEMLGLIIETARLDERIKAVWMNGSRANPHAKRDLFQDYDIVYLVEETKPFYEDASWIDRFGERLYAQRPDEVDRCNGLPVDFDRCYGWLIQLADGNRLDLHVVTKHDHTFLEDGMYVVLLDKEHRFDERHLPSDAFYYVKKPTQEQFWACCNEFWWCLNNVAKGLWRKEVPYVHDALYQGSHPQLIRLLYWQVGFAHDFQVSCGKSGKYLEDYLERDVWNRFLHTYAGFEIADLWQAVFCMCDLFMETAQELAKRYGYHYDQKEADAAYAHLRHVHGLPADAKAIYEG